MLISEIILREGYYNELLATVQDILIRAISKGIKEIPTDRFKQILAKQGYVSTTDEIIQAVDQSGYASSVDAAKIVPKGELPADMDTDAEPSVDVGKMAGKQAMKNIKSEL
jgi:hypothetical protein